jgi:hypothetical protein
MRSIGILLVVVGVAALVYGGLNFNRERTVLKVGSVSVTASEHRNIPVPAVAGVVVLVGGLALLAGTKGWPRRS